MKRKIALVLISMIFLFAIVFYYSNDIVKFNKIDFRNEQILSQSLESAREEVFYDNIGITYYIAADGKSEEGTSSNNPMNLKTALNKKYYGNDKILFKNGDIFYGTVKFDIEIDNNSYVYIGSYGESSQKPIIRGLNMLSNYNAWEVEESGIYKIDLSIEENFYGIGNIGSDPYNIGFLVDEQGTIYGNRKNSKTNLKNEFEFYCEKNYIYVKSNDNPSKKIGMIGFAPRNNLLRLSSNTIVENLNIQYTGAHGIVNEDFNIENVYIRNCIVENVGGSVMDSKNFTRYGNAIQFWESCDNILVNQCIIRNSYDSGFTIQGNNVKNGFKNVCVDNNIFINNNYSIEMFCKNNLLGEVQIVDGYKNCVFNNNIFINQGKGWSFDVRPDKKIAPEILIWNLLSNRTDISIFNNKYFNSRRIYCFKNYNDYKEEYLNSVKIDNNTFLTNSKTSYLIDDKYNDYYEKDILKEYKQDQHSEFNLLSEKEISKINNEEILKSNNYDEIKAYYENLEKEFGYEGLLNELLDTYKELETNVTNKDVLSKINELKMKIQNKQNDDKLLTQAEIREWFDLHYEMIKVINQENNTEIIDLTNKLNEFEEIYYKLFNLSKTDISYNKDLLRNKIENAKKIIEDNEELQTDLFNGLIAIIQEYYDDSDSSINGLVCNKLLDVFYSYAYKNVKVYITYSEMNITNKDVVATLQSDIPIEMNMSNSHTFTENGSFTFEFVVNGEEKELTATVDWIDKKAPVITGYENRVDELEAVVINVIDENLSKIVVTLNGEYIDFNNGDTLFKPGTYQILATDKAGNSSEVTLRIVDYIESNKTYYISNDGQGNGLSEDTPMSVSQASKTRFYAGDKILFKAGEKYKLRLDWVMMGSPDNKVVISSYGQGDRPIIDGYISLVSNLEISNIYFVNDKESSIVTNQEFSENIVISNCIFQDVVDTGIYLNRQVKNCEIKDCIFRNCTNGISMKNDFQNLLLTDIKIHDNIFVSGTKAIVISGRNENEVFEKVEIYNNIFMNYTSNGSSIISFGFIEDTKFDVTIYNNVYYNFLRVYSINDEYSENFKNNVRSDSNTFYSFNDSKFIENTTNFDDLNNSYNIDEESKNIVMDANRYKVNEVTYMANNSTDKNEIIDYMNQTISASNSGQSNNNGNKPTQNGGSNNSGSGVNGIDRKSVV